MRPAPAGLFCIPDTLAGAASVGIEILVLLYLELAQVSVVVGVVAARVAVGRGWHAVAWRLLGRPWRLAWAMGGVRWGTTTNHDPTSMLRLFSRQ